MVKRRTPSGRDGAYVTIVARVSGGEFPGPTSIPGAVRMHSGSMSRRQCGAARPIQLEQVVRQADQHPLGGHVSDSAEGKAPEAAELLDLPEDGFDDRLAQRVEAPPGGRGELRPHVGG